ncbi:MAG: glycosyltransferase family 2 protein [Thermoguttaceae bacterium]
MTDYPREERFESATVLLPVINETVSLDETVRIILRDARADLKELLIVVCPRTTAESMAVVDRLQKELGSLVVVHHQALPFLGGALREGFAMARGSHVIMMASDLETDPGDVVRLIAEARKNPSAVVCTSRWIRGGRFHGYSPVKLLCNWLFQHLFSLLYGTRLTDMTYGYRILPTRLVQAIRWEELRHPFNLETIVKPLRLGVPVGEIATVWRCRSEGQSQNPFFRNLAYFRIGLKTRLARKSSILAADRTGHDEHAGRHPIAGKGGP